MLKAILVALAILYLWVLGITTFVGVRAVQQNHKMCVLAGNLNDQAIADKARIAAGKAFIKANPNAAILKGLPKAYIAQSQARDARTLRRERANADALAC